MESKAIFFEHLADGERTSPIRLLFPEPAKGGDMASFKSAKSGDGWKLQTMGGSGVGCLFSYREYNITKPTIFRSKVSEPVLVLRIQVSNESYNGFEADKSGMKLWKEDECRLFFMDGDVLECKFLPGEHLVVDVFFRPELLGGLRELSIVEEIMKTRSNHSCADSYVRVADQKMEHFLMQQVLYDVQDGKLSESRFRYLLDCLVALTCGENVEIADAAEVNTNVSDTVINEAGEIEEEVCDGPILHQFNKEEQVHLNLLAQLDRDELLSIFEKERIHTKEREEHWREINQLFHDLNLLVEQEEANSKWTYPKFFMHFARSFEKKYESTVLKEGVKEELKNVIVKCCELAFKTSLPTAADAPFYAKWVDRPLMSKPIDLPGFADILSMVMPPGTADFSHVDNSPAGKRLFEEKMLENFGFRPMSHFTGETAADKPIEVVALYSRLMAVLTETMSLDQEDGLKRSDIVRELDNAYEHNDLTALLQLEIKHLAIDKDYVAQQDDQRLRFFIMALTREQEGYDDLIGQIQVNTDALQNAQRYGDAGFDMEKYADNLLEEMRKRDLNMELLIKEFDEIIANIDNLYLIGFAKKFIKTMEGESPLH